MKTRIVTLLMAIALVVAMAIPTLAASGINENEQKLLDEFSAVLDKYEFPKQEDYPDIKYSDYGKVAGTYDVKAQYLKVAKEALEKADVNADGYAKLSQAIKDVDAKLTATAGGDPKNLDRHAAIGVWPECQKIVNDAAKSSGMSIDIEKDPKTGYITIKVETPQGSVKTNTAPTVKSTGFNAAATYGVVAVLAVALLGGVALIRRNHLLA